MSRFNVEAAAITHIGLVSIGNEDNYYVNGRYKSDSTVSTDGVADKKVRDSYVYAVCDGTGGENYGDLASLIAMATLEKYKEKNIRQTIGSYLKTANEYINDLIKVNGKPRTGTTLALLSIQNDTAVSYRVGDSRVYLCRRGCLYLMSESDDGTPEDEQSAQHIGTYSSGENIVPYASDEIKVRRGDTFMLCTAGLFGSVGDEEIVEMLSKKSDTATDMTKRLVSAAQDNHGKENVTVVVLKLV